MDLPTGLPVPLARPARRRVAGAVPGVARVADAQVTPGPGARDDFAARDRNGGELAEGLARASQFAPYYRRMMLGPALPAGAQVLGTADRLGIGVAARARSGRRRCCRSRSRCRAGSRRPRGGDSARSPTGRRHRCADSRSGDRGSSRAGQAGSSAHRLSESCGLRPSRRCSCCRNTRWRRTARCPGSASTEPGRTSWRRPAGRRSTGKIPPRRGRVAPRRQGRPGAEQLVDLAALEPGRQLGP